MSKQVWKVVIGSKFFYVHTYRRAGTYLLVSGLLNVLLLIGVAYVHFTEEKPTYYATNGITPPLALSVLQQPNTSSEPLLRSEIEEEEGARAIPE